MLAIVPRDHSLLLFTYGFARFAFCKFLRANSPKMAEKARQHSGGNGGQPDSRESFQAGFACRDARTLRCPSRSGSQPGGHPYLPMGMLARYCCAGVAPCGRSRRSVGIRLERSSGENIGESSTLHRFRQLSRVEPFLALVQSGNGQANSKAKFIWEGNAMRVSFEWLLTAVSHHTDSL